MNRQNVEDLYPLTPLQQGMLFHTVYSPSSGAYTEQLTMRMQGEMRAELYARAWRAAVERHGALRTAFVWEKVPKPLQVVFRAVEVPFETHDWRGHSEAEQSALMAAFLEDDRRRGFDLTKAPLVRINVFLLDEERCSAVLTMHHLLFDGWSFGTVNAEVMSLYNAWARGETVELPRLKPFREYVAWLARQDMDAAERFWRRSLDGFRAPTPLGVDRPCAPGAVTEEYGYAKVKVGPETARALQALARRHGLTVNTLLQGAWALLLSRYAGEPDVVFGCTVSGRPGDLPGVREMVGLFINTLPMRVRVEPAAPLMEWLHALQDDQAELRQHEHSPLVDVQGWSEVPRGRPLFESLVVFENYPMKRDDPGDILKIVDGASPERTNYPLVLVVVPGPDALILRLTYDPARLAPAAAEGVLRHLSTLLEEMARDPGRRLCDLPMVTEEERARLVDEWGTRALAYPRDATLTEVFEAQVAATPDAVAVAFGGDSLTYAELNARANRLARRLRALGAGPGVRVALPSARSLELVVSLLGVLKSGAAYVPLDPGYPAERLAFLLADSGAAALVVPAGVPAAFAGFRGPVVSLRDVVAADDDPHADANPGHGGQAATDPACLIYTSGSTGRPKAVLATHRAFVRVAVAGGFAEIGPGTGFLQLAPLTFDVGSFEVFAALLNGARLEVFPPEVPSPEALGAFLRDRAVDTLWLTTGLLNQVVEAAPEVLGCARRLLTGGEAMSPATAKRLLAVHPHLPVVNLYGPTETGVYATAHRVTEEDLGRTSIPLGHPVPNTRVVLVDAALRPVATGVPGEVCIGGDAVAIGYHGRPALTAERFVPDPFSAEPGARMYRTGDRARWLPEGVMEFIGRLDFQVKLRGFRVEPDEVAAALCDLEEVRDAVVLARSDAGGELYLAAYVVADVRDAEALRASLRGRLPDFMVPAAWVFLDALPLNAHGKVDRAALPEPDEGARARAAAHVPPRTETEMALAELWKPILRVEKVGAHDDFFSMGGHSLKAHTLMVAMREKMDADLPIRAIFEAPVLADLAARIDQHRAEVLAGVVAELEGMSDEEARARLAEAGAPV
ncbi:MAG TPA: amino acid adenylation domain-containing protein [Longimicrobium sp.]|nr:amino acid adenylation domain-containing protein [Longimicrobium sp.]